MEPFSIGLAGLGAAGLATIGAFGLAFRQHRRQHLRQTLRQQQQAEEAPVPDVSAPEAVAPGASRRALPAPSRGRPRSTAERLEAMVIAQAELGQRLETLAAQASAPEERMQAMAGQLLGLIRDKNATLETALAGLDQLRARMRTLEQMGEPAEARALMEALGNRVDSLQSAQAATAAALDVRLAAMAEPGGAEVAADLAGRIARLHEARDAGLEATLARLQPLESRLAAAEGGVSGGRDGLKRLEARMEALGAEQAAARAEVARIRAEAEGPARALAEQLARLHAQKEALAEALVARVAAVEAALADRVPAAALAATLDRLATGLTTTLSGEIGARLEAWAAQEAATGQALATRLAALETGRTAGEAALAPLATRLGELEAEIAARDPAATQARFAERLEAVQRRLALMEAAENPFAGVSEQLTALYAQKDAAVETVFARLAPLEAKLAEIEAGLADRDPAAALDRFAERLEGVQGRLSALETAENPFAGISEQLGALYAQKDAAVETVFARLAPLEAKLDALEAGMVERDPTVALDRFAERLEGVQGRVSALETAENPFAGISEQLGALYAQKDAAVETVFARLAPLEAKLAEVEAGLADRDPAAALDRFAERLEGVQGRLSALETAENPFAEISGQLTALYAQKDAAVETVFARLAPLEAKLAEVEAGLAERDPAAALDRFAERLEGVQGRLSALETAENPFAGISEQLGALYAQKDAAVETVFARLAPLEAKLDALEAGMVERDPTVALDRFAERLEGVQGRLSALETAENPFAEITGQLTALYAQKDATVETVFARLAPLEAKLAEVEGGLGRLAPLAEDDPRAAVEGLRMRLEALHWSQGEVAAGLAALQAALQAAAESPAASGTEVAAELADRLTRLYAQRDASTAAVLARLAPLEARLVALEADPRDPDAEAARVQATVIAAQLAAVRAAAEQTALFADRLALLEAGLPGLTAAQAARMGRVPGGAGDLEAVLALPQVVSLHRR